MYRIVALTTALAFVTLPANPAAAAAGTELVMEEHFSEAGYHVDLYVTRDDEALLSEATITDPASGDELDVWTDGATVWWHGTADGEPVRGHAPAGDIGIDPQEAPICFTPITAILCLGAIVILAGSSCAHTTKGPCPVDPSGEIPGGAGGVPSDPGGDGDGDGDGDGGSGGGGDED